MAMVGKVWGDLIATDLLAQNPGASKLSPAEQAQFFKAWETICTDNVTYIDGNAEVTVTSVSSGSDTAPGTIS